MFCLCLGNKQAPDSQLPHTQSLLSVSPVHTTRAESKATGSANASPSKVGADTDHMATLLSGPDGKSSTLPTITLIVMLHTGVHRRMRRNIANDGDFFPKEM